MKTETTSALLVSIALVLAGCGAGVPVQLRIDEHTFTLSLDGALDEVAARLLPPDSPSLPEAWPHELPELCYDALISTDPDDGGRIDLTPDPAVDPEGADVFGPVNSGFVSRLEIERLVVRVETNTLNVPLPPFEIQAADAIDASGADRRAWRTVGAVGASGLSPSCLEVDAGTAPVNAVDPGELADLEFVWTRSGESFLNNQLADEPCAQRASNGDGDPLDCKELSLRAKTRLRFDTRESKDKPRGEAVLRLILVATFYVDPV